ncbi:DUF4236 domain-containing protein [Streptomyces gibsoniae]|uniref:DUF4236 domain-containing protein n=1 Tax=Streptomyces gibsoniae TaxID=3075529 RepID=A0ABU2U1T1_9ACTN|nr:DUF4236 domain-containing protein [Streptomyces sp. DSM 41699]MDT0467055.1 DUF4236 domain-containing protein [Streptomyces sp. DSM 41699]
MGFSYRKSLKAGPIRVTASKSGISYSAGVKGARVTKRADGRVQTTVSAPGTGMRYTTSSGRPAGRQAGRTAVRQAPPNGGPYTVLGEHYAWAGEPARFKGFAFRRVTLYPDRVEIRRLVARTVIPARDIVEVRAGAPSLSTHAYLWFVVPGELHGYTSGRHVIMFNALRPGHRRTWRRLVEALGQR